MFFQTRLLSVRWIERSFLFFKKFFLKHPPRIVSHFKQVRGLLIFFSKYPHFFDSWFKQVRAWIFSKKFWKVGQFGCAFRHHLSKWVKGVFLWQDYQRNLNGNVHYSSIPKQAEEHTTTCAANVVMTVNKAFGQSLSVVLCIVPKEVSILHLIVPISTILDKRITDIRFKTKRLTEKNFDNFGTFSVQKRCCRVIILTRRSKQFK